MLISIHSRGDLPSIVVEAPCDRRCLWIDVGEGQSIQLSQLEAAHLIAELQGGLDEIDADAQRVAEQHDQYVIDSMPLFDVVDA